MNNAIITTRFVIEQNSPVVTVYRDADGDWQFLGEEEVTESDARVISLEQIVKIDNTLLEVLEIEPGFSAAREFIGDKWQITKV